MMSHGPNIHPSIPPQSRLRCSGSAGDPAGGEKGQASLPHPSTTDTPGSLHNTVDTTANSTVDTTVDTTVRTALGHLDVCESDLDANQFQLRRRRNHQTVVKSVCVCLCVRMLCIAVPFPIRWHCQSNLPELDTPVHESESNLTICLFGQVD